MITRKNMKRGKYQVFSAALGKFTATTNPDKPAFRRDYRVFDTREEAQRWADEQNATTQS